jgi:integrase/recombinase XerD
VRALFSDAVGSGHLLTNPASRLAINAKAVGGKQDERERVKTMTRAELAAVLCAIPDRNGGRDRLFFAVLAGTGCWISEALGLEWVDLGQGGVTLRIERQWYRGKLKRYTKTANGQRTISLSPELAQTLWERGAELTGPMFATRSGKRLSARDMTRVLYKAIEEASLTDVSPHSFRHTHGSMLLEQGWPLTEVAHRLGDDVHTVAKTYAHKLRDSKRDLGFLDSLGSVGGSDSGAGGQ